MEKQDTFVEKLVTQVIKNLQVKISNIHIRYEDDVSIQARVTCDVYTFVCVYRITQILINLNLCCKVNSK